MAISDGDKPFGFIGVQWHGKLRQERTKWHEVGRPDSKTSIFQTSFFGLLSVLIHSNEVAKGQITQNLTKIGL